jgi:hypothetical protein
MDPAVLCTIVERLFGLVIMTTRHKESLHGVLLPRSWILGLWKDFITFKDGILAPLWVFAQTMEKLLKDIYSGQYLRQTTEDLRNVFGWFRVGLLCHQHWLTSYRETGLQKQGDELVKGSSPQIYTRSLCRSHVNLFLSDGLRLLTSIDRKKMQILLSA